MRTYGVLSGEVGVEGLVPTLQVIPATSGVARAAIEQLLAGKLANGVSSAIPDGTRLLGLSIKDRVATVDLSREFETGGGSASSFYRLSQVVYTLTQFSSVGSVLFQVDGRTVTTFGPEGIVLDGPQTRADYEDQLPVDLRRSTGVRRRDRQPGAHRRQRQRVRGRASRSRSWTPAGGPCTSSTRWRPAAPDAVARST